MEVLRKHTADLDCQPCVALCPRGKPSRIAPFGKMVAIGNTRQIGSIP
jgi:hypothetical protein